MHSRSLGYWVRSGLIFLMHQIVSTEGVIWLTILGTFSLRGSITSVHEAWAHSAFMRAMHLVLSNTPFFPVQIALGAYIGWRLFNRWRHQSMFWVWILPCVVLIYAVITIQTLIPFSVAAERGLISHFFGWGCQADLDCYDQLSFTQPFYTSVAYSLGALVARKSQTKLLRNDSGVEEIALGRG